MIHMPRRSVTRFFVPLIDVLLLLFCIFLLMPIANEEQLDQQRQTVGELQDTVETLEKDLRRRTRELADVDALRADADELQRLRDEVDKLRKSALRSLQERTAFHILDVDGKNGELSFYDPTLPNPSFPIKDEKTAQALIEKHRQKSAGRDLYYYFLYPRPKGGFPTLRQERLFQTWFKNVDHSLKEGA